MPRSSRSSSSSSMNSETGPSIPLYNKHHTPRKDYENSTTPVADFLANVHAFFFPPPTSKRGPLRYLPLALLILVPVFWIAIYAGMSTKTSSSRDVLVGGKSPDNTQGSDSHTNTSSPQTATWDLRAEQVKLAFLHAYDSYEKLAFPSDELLPLDGKAVNNFNGWGVSVVDSIDTMYLMKLDSQYQRALAHVKSLDWTAHKDFVPFFETVIRYLGGTLAAYGLTGDNAFLQSADRLGRALLPVFNTESGLPPFAVNPHTGENKSGWMGSSASLAELGSCQMEYKYLAHLTGQRDYYQKVESVTKLMAKVQNTNNHLFPVNLAIKNGAPASSRFSVGAMADSAYEYLLKQYLMTAKSEPRSLDMYMKSVQGIMENLLYLTPNRKLLFVTDISGTQPSWLFEHLSCFLPGVFALGAISLPLSASDKQLHLWMAEGLAETCYLTYADQASGLGPDEMYMTSQSTKWIDEYRKWESSGASDKGTYPPGVKGVDLVVVKDSHQREYSNKTPNYLLRPETVESLFIMYRATGAEMWRERAWTIFQAIEKQTKTTNGYASVYNVDKEVADKVNSMPSYFLAETLKYFYLLFRSDSGDAGIPLDRWVFNTEAHPLPIYTWTSDEIAKLGVETSL